MMPETQCSRRVPASFRRVMADLRALWNAPGQEPPELGRLEDYGLSIDFVEAGTVILRTCGS
jgi:hypothetical protein